jgi:hypothetical protein
MESMQAINAKVANLQDVIQNLGATAPYSGAQLGTAIKSAQEVLVEIIGLAKKLPNSSVADFVMIKALLLDQIFNAAQISGEDNPVLNETNELMRQLATAYQEYIVPMLTRLNNLANDEENSAKITAITALGNEIITCNSQLHQFNEKLSQQEKIVTILGIILMLSSINFMITILSRPTPDVAMDTAFAIMNCGSTVFRLAMQAHQEDPGSDLILTSLKKMDPLINEIRLTYSESDAQKATSKYAKKPPTKKAPAKSKIAKTEEVIEEEEEIEIIDIEIVENKKPAKTKATRKKTSAQDSEAAADQEEQSSPSFMSKVKGVLDMFNKK